MASNTFIFIPDISGFTQFVQQTEIRHSRHIIRELLEGIIHANTLNLSISEIEGDAVLFFRFGAPPSLAELFDQIKAMFVGFHSLVRAIEHNRVCQCGACSSASNLTLKFIAHFGTTEQMQIGIFSKLVGSDVILPHRLLKNNIPSSEYALLTDQYYHAETRGTLPEWIELQQHHETVPDFGEVDLHFASLQAMRRFVPDAAPPEALSAPENPIAGIQIGAPLLFAYDILIDDKRKLDWVPGLKDMRQDSPINRIGGTHNACSRILNSILSRSRASVVTRKCVTSMRHSFLQVSAL